MEITGSNFPQNAFVAYIDIDPAGLDAVVPLIAGYRAQAGADADAGAGRILAWRAGLLYAHPCECLAATAWVSQRVGRDGVDAWLALDLVPR